MTKRLLISCLALTISAGCMFTNRGNKAKEDTSITREVQETFRKRWVDRRTAELVAQGTNAEAARTQAASEFAARYDFTSAAAK